MATGGRKRFSRGDVTIHNADVLHLYEEWEPPVVIVSDGAYGISGFPGDPPTAEEVASWYEPHIKKWSEKATPLTTLWFWNREIGWANVHPLLDKYGWEYISCNVWDKGIAHIAGDSNVNVLRRFPQVTEVCVHYIKRAEFKVKDRVARMQEWLRLEWERTELPQSKANEACGVKNAATRKYLTKDHLWYFPPPKRFGKLVEYANRYGNPNGRPYFFIDGKKPFTEQEWAKMRPKFYCELGVTNVWGHPPLHDEERLKEDGRAGKAIHLNQKPLQLIELTIKASSDKKDVIWEPFGGLCTAAIASHKLGRSCYSAEIDEKIYEIAVQRLQNYDKREAERIRIKGFRAYRSLE